MNDQNHIVDVTADNLQSVLQQSTEKPVLLFIGIASDQASVSQFTLLETLVASYQGKFVLAKIDAEADQSLARQLLSQLQATALPLRCYCMKADL